MVNGARGVACLLPLSAVARDEVRLPAPSAAAVDGQTTGGEPDGAERPPASGTSPAAAAALATGGGPAAWPSIATRRAWATQRESNTCTSALLEFSRAKTSSVTPPSSASGLARYLRRRRTTAASLRMMGSTSTWVEHPSRVSASAPPLSNVWITAARRWAATARKSGVRPCASRSFGLHPCASRPSMAGVLDVSTASTRSSSMRARAPGSNPCARAKRSRLGGAALPGLPRTCAPPAAPSASSVQRTGYPPCRSSSCASSA
mmetsp:Transcript_20220/g.52189  ORF Transcript_20220/g.52189 Transcript_20220/m.52189 type:complete len:262 (+) Transcript_20220:177-962(+)